MESIEIKNISKKYGDKTVLDNLSFSVSKGEITAILGESGSGKTTLLNVLSGITEYCGKIENQPEKISMVFQKDALIPNLTVEENIKLVSKKDCDELLKRAGLFNNKNDYVKNLSGGMARRVAIIRALSFESEYLFLDEPFSSLDWKLKLTFIDLLKKINKEKKITIIFVTHDIKEAVLLSDRILMLKEGKIVFDKRKEDTFEEELFSRLIRTER